ncbi:acyltransferase family protein [Novosphingobium terrae]|uniref:acyltransferase family protein n=1 Tax=Novosphingobium terrae TaxID=2726189 RepID=UPI0019813939|nr:acyltransferase [Novosphingobium terrae]
MTLDEKLQIAKGRPSGFDYMRLILSVLVVMWHTIVTSYGPEAQSSALSHWRPLIAALLPMFFALSGFLVAGSLERCRSLVSFLGLRLIRIYPALAVEVLLSAFILGPLLTTVPLDSYFTDPKFHRYLLNIFGDIHFQLPGLFLGNPNPDRVNGQLWTVPYELLCYITLAALAALSLTKYRTLFTGAVALLWLSANAVFMYKHGLSTAEPMIVPGYILIFTFLCGIGIYLWRDKLPFNLPLAAVCAVVSAVLMFFPIAGDALVPLPLSYLTVYLGIANPRKFGFLRGADYSYGIFLYGYAIQQAWMSLSPGLHHWYLNALLTLPVATAFAAGSWHFVEKPALKLRNQVYALENHWVRHRERFIQPLLSRLLPPTRISESETL